MSVTLKEFVEQTLLDITSAVDNAQKSSALSIAPGFVEGQVQLEPQMIQFAVQVSVSEEQQKSGNGEVSVPVINILKAGIEANVLDKSESLVSQSISFSVPVYFQTKKMNAQRQRVMLREKDIGVRSFLTEDVGDVFLRQ